MRRRSEPGLGAQRLLAGPTSHSVAVPTAAPNSAFGGVGLKENETNLRNGVFRSMDEDGSFACTSRTDPVLEERGNLAGAALGGLHGQPPR